MMFCRYSLQIIQLIVEDFDKLKFQEVPILYLIIAVETFTFADWSDDDFKWFLCHKKVEEEVLVTFQKPLFSGSNRLLHAHVIWIR